jgi:hypothetical protein
MAPHHQHRHGEARLVELVERGFDLMHGFAQRTLEPEVLGQAELAPHLDGRVEMSPIRRIAGADRRNGLVEVGKRGTANLPPERVEFLFHGFCKVRVTLRVLLVAAQQEILFGAAAFEQRAAEPVDPVRDRGHVRGDHPIALLRGVAGQVDAADQCQAAETDGADRRDLVRNADANTERHECFPGDGG